MTGENLSAEQVGRLEAKLIDTPDDVDTRTKLLGYYFPKRAENTEAREAQLRHILWLVEHRPESPILEWPYGQLDRTADYEALARAKQLWVQHTEEEPDNLTLLSNMASFLFSYDKAAAVLALEKGAELDSKNPAWARQLGQIHLLDAKFEDSEDARKVSAEKALNYYDSAYELSNPPEQKYMLEYITDAALLANEMEKTREYAKLMLADTTRDWNYGNNVHYGNLALGRIALIEGDVDAAKQYLLEAGKTPGSPQLDSFGPNMELARQLLERGEKDIVLEYFELCGKFWDDDGELEEWTALVEAGLKPDFSMNL